MYLQFESYEVRNEPVSSFSLLSDGVILFTVSEVVSCLLAVMVECCRSI